MKKVLILLVILVLLVFNCYSRDGVDSVVVERVERIESEVDSLKRVVDSLSINLVFVRDLLEGMVIFIDYESERVDSLVLEMKRGVKMGEFEQIPRKKSIDSVRWESRDWIDR
jgi:hypothetical protein